MNNSNIDINYIPQFSKVFSSKIVKEILSYERSELINTVVEKSKIKLSYGDTYFILFEKLYEYLFNNYQNEYIFKNEFLLNLIKKEYKTKHTFLQEIQIDNNIVDLLVINGKTTAYEIKTKYDSLYRLESQLDTYSKVFDNINVIISSEHLNKVELLIESKYKHVGIFILSNKKIKIYRKSIRNINIDIKYVNKMLKLKELRKYNLSSISLEQLEKEKALKIFRNILKEREKNGSLLIDKLPDSIKSLISNMHLLGWQKEKLVNKLSKKIILETKIIKKL